MDTEQQVANLKRHVINYSKVEATILRMHWSWWLIYLDYTEEHSMQIGISDSAVQFFLHIDHLLLIPTASIPEDDDEGYKDEEHSTSVEQAMDNKYCKK